MRVRLLDQGPALLLLRDRIRTGRPPRGRVGEGEQRHEVRRELRRVAGLPACMLREKACTCAVAAA